MSENAQRGVGFVAMLGVIGIVASAFRFTGLSWGLPYPLHPDEGVILERVAAMGWGNLNPGFFIYPSFFIYQVFLLDRLVAALGGEPWQVVYAARALTAAYSLAAVGFVYLLGARVGGRRVGIVAAALTAVTGALTLHAHYAVTDTPVTALATAVLWLSVRAWQRRSPTEMFAAAAIAGLAVSTKYSSFVVCFVPWLGYMAMAARAGASLSRRAAATALLAAAAVTAFLVTSPFTLLDHRAFLDDMAVESHLQSAARAGYHIDPLESPGLMDRAFVANAAAAIDDLGFVALALAGGATMLLFAAAPAAWRRSAAASPGARQTESDDGRRSSRLLTADPVAAVLVGVWVVGYFAFMAPSAIGGQRYMLPVYPALMVLAALAIDAVARAASDRAAAARNAGATRAPAGKSIATAATLVLLVAAAAVPFLDAVATTRLLARPDTRLLARDWILTNLPQRSHLAREFYAPPIHTDDNYRLSQPFSLTEHPLETYCMERVDYLVLSSLNAARYLDSDAARFAEERAWYERLDQRTRVVQRIEGVGDLELHHPEIVIRRLFCPDTLPTDPSR